MNAKELELKFGELLIENDKEFSSNLNPFDMFKIGYDYANLKLKESEVSESELQNALDDGYLKAGANAYYGRGFRDCFKWMQSKLNKK